LKNKIPKAPQEFPSFKTNLHENCSNVLRYVAKYDESHSQQNVSYVELGRISGILLREEFRNHLEINSGQVYEFIGDFSESEFWKAYENCSRYELVSDAILGSDRYVKTFGVDQMERFKQIQNTFQSSTANPSDKRLKDAVNKSFYMTKKRMFQYMFRKTPDSHQNIAVLHRASSPRHTGHLHPATPSIFTPPHRASSPRAGRGRGGAGGAEAAGGGGAGSAVATIGK
jgi:hypothetical protein